MAIFFGALAVAAFAPHWRADPAALVRRSAFSAWPALAAGGHAVARPVSLAPTRRAAAAAAIRMAEGGEERNETLLGLGVISGITAFCFIFFSGMTSQGVDDVIAGNLLLVALAGAGAATHTPPGHTRHTTPHIANHVHASAGGALHRPRLTQQCMHVRRRRALLL